MIRTLVCARVARRAAAAAVVVLSSMVAACVQYPTERQGTVDLRPQVSFRFEAADPRLAQARVMVDDLDVGALSDAADGKASIRVLPGIHSIRVVRNSQVLLEERVYLGDGVSRPFIVK
jgi:hypothetical protein